MNGRHSVRASLDNRRRLNVQKPNIIMASAYKADRDKLLCFLLTDAVAQQMVEDRETGRPLTAADLDRLDLDSINVDQLLAALGNGKQIQCFK